MLHCTTNFTWYLMKFLIGFTGMLYLYVSLLKEDEKNCICGARMRELKRRKGEKRLDRCECVKGLQSKRYPCGCKKKMIQSEDVTSIIANEYIKRNCTGKHACCTRRNSY